VGGYDSKSAEIAASLFKKVTKGKIIVTDCLSAEMAKLAENSFRDVNIAFANELALICERMGVDVTEAIRLANTHPRVNVHKPSCGVGGPCIGKDHYLLLHSAEQIGFRSKMMKPSRKLNEYMTEHTIELVIYALKTTGKDVEKSKIAVLGTAYKGETDDATNSPSEKIVKKLMDSEANVMVYDPYCKESFGAQKARDVMEAVKGADCIVIATDHKIFAELKLEKIKTLMREKPAIVDGRRVVDPVKARMLGFTYYGIGYKT